MARKATSAVLDTDAAEVALAASDVVEAQVQEPEVDDAADMLDGDPQVPEAIRLHYPHGFIAEDGSRHFWGAGQVVREPDQVALLISRGAPHDVMED